MSETAIKTIDEKAFKAKVLKFREDNPGVSWAKITGGYTNTTKIEDFFLKDKGSFTLVIAIRIEKFIDDYGI